MCLWAWILCYTEFGHPNRYLSVNKIQTWTLKDLWLQVTWTCGSGSLQVFPRVNPQVTHRDLHLCSVLLGSEITAGKRQRQDVTRFPDAWSWWLYCLARLATIKILIRFGLTRSCEVFQSPICPAELIAGQIGLWNIHVMSSPSYIALRV